MNSTREVNPLFVLAFFGLLVADTAIETGRIADTRYSIEDVERLGLDRTTQWRRRKSGDLQFKRHGARVFYTPRHLMEAGIL